MLAPSAVQKMVLVVAGASGEKPWREGSVSRPTMQDRKLMR